MPSYSTEAAMPPTVTDSASAGMGTADADGAAPVATCGETAPAPVMKSVMMPPRAALVLGTGAPLELVKMPGATVPIETDWDAICPLLLTVTTAVELGAIS